MIGNISTSRRRLSTPMQHTTPARAMHRLAAIDRATAAAGVPVHLAIARGRCWTVTIF